MRMPNFLRKLFSFRPAPRIETEVREFSAGGERHWVQVPKETFQVDGNQLSFVQAYVQKETLQAKRTILHLRNKYGDDWRLHIGEIKEEYLRKGLAKQDLTLPVIVTPHPDRPGHFIVLNGVHTSFALMEVGSAITVKLASGRSPPAKGTKTFSKHELRIESSRR